MASSRPALTHIFLLEFLAFADQLDEQPRLLEVLPQPLPVEQLAAHRAALRAGGGGHLAGGWHGQRARRGRHGGGRRARSEDTQGAGGEVIGHGGGRQARSEGTQGAAQMGQGAGG